MLEMRPNCECCGRPLAPDARAYVCSLECTFCPSCAEETLRRVCPNCGGELRLHPIRAARLLARFPASAGKIVKLGGCG
ncbi:MAG TPA: DUF1272 domain-containing protein [Gammaproteobacteria bacterium]|nr:DUF1272 domain-containing protein [Gammaproteobacteria bacterium]